MRYSHFIIFGGPGETRATLEETLARAKTLPGAYYFGTLGMRIYPGTPLWRTVAPESRGEVPADYLEQVARLDAYPSELGSPTIDAADPDSRYRVTSVDGHTSVDIRDIINGRTAA